MAIQFVTYFRKLNSDQKRELADACGTTAEYLAKQVVLISKGKALSLFKPAICSAIETFSEGQVTRKDLRPDDWHDIWIELRPKQTIQAVCKSKHVQKEAS